MIIYENDKPHYFDKNGNAITDGCTIRYPDGHTEKVYLTTDGQIGTDATNREWIESGRAAPLEYGIYPLGNLETNEVEVIEPLADLLQGLTTSEISAGSFQIASQEPPADAENRAIFNALADIEQKLFYAATSAQDETYKEAHRAAKAALEAFAKATGCHN